MTAAVTPRDKCEIAHRGASWEWAIPTLSGPFLEPWGPTTAPLPHSVTVVGPSCPFRADAPLGPSRSGPDRPDAQSFKGVLLKESQTLVRPPVCRCSLQTVLV